MRLVELHIKALPGLESELHLTGLSRGVTVLVGPNASGKSSIVRALRYLWEPHSNSSGAVHVSGRFEERREGQPTRYWTAVRLGAQLTWEVDGTPTDAPLSPSQHLLDSHLIAAAALNAHGHTDEHIEGQLRREMAGGFDLPSARVATQLSLAGHRAKSTEFAGARRNLAAAHAEQGRLVQRFTQRAAAEEALERATKQTRLLPHYQQALELHENEAVLRGLNARLESFPPDMALLGGDEGDEMSELKRRLATSEQLWQGARQAAANAQELVALSGVAASSLSVADGRRLERTAVRMVELAGQADGAELQRGKTAAILAVQWRQLGGRPSEKARVTPDVLEQTEASVEQRMRSAAQLNSVKVERERIEAAQAELVDEPQSERLFADAHAALARWLAVPVSGVRSVILAALAVSATVALVLALTLTFAPASIQAPAPAITSALAGPDAATGPFSGRNWTTFLPSALLGLVSALAWMALISRRLLNADQRRERAAAQNAFTASGLVPPESWKHPQVAARLEQLLTHAADQQRRRLEASRLQLLHAENSRQLALAQQEHDRSLRRLRELADITGYDLSGHDVMASGAAFVSWLRAARGFLENVEQDAALVNELGHHHRKGEELYRQVVQGLADTPWAVSAPTESVRMVKGKIVGAKLPLADATLKRCEELLEALRQRDEALSARRRAREELERAEREVAAARGSIRRLLAGCGLRTTADGVGAAAGESELEAVLEPVLESVRDAEFEWESAAEKELLNRLALLADWRALVQHRNDMQAVVDSDRERLAAAPEVLALVADREALEQGRDACLQAQKEQQRLSAELTELATEVRLTEQQRSLEQARAALSRSSDDLEEIRRRAHLNAVTALLIDEVEAEHQVNHQPAVLERAKAWFSRFTHHAFELEFAANDAANTASAGTAPSEPRILARDTRTCKLLAPQQLSSGTCAQLLLSLRVSYAAGFDNAGLRLPFFLDEALSSADAARFKEVARSLLLFAVRDERQVFYLSARRDDAKLWREAAEAESVGTAESACKLQVVDLPEILQDAQWARWRGAEPSASGEALAKVPEPRGFSTAAYAAALRVPPIDPWREVGAVHLFHLLQDDLPLLHRLLTVRLSRAGQLPGLLSSGQAGLLPLSSEETTNLRRRFAGLTAWHRSWREGRDRPVTIEALRESGAVSEGFLDSVSELAKAVGYDPRALLEGLAARKVSHFRQSSVEQLEEWLEERGYFAERPRLDGSSLILCTAAALVEPTSAGPEQYAAQGAGEVTIDTTKAAPTTPASEVDTSSDTVMFEAGQLVDWWESAIVPEKESV